MNTSTSSLEIVAEDARLFAASIVPAEIIKRISGKFRIIDQNTSCGLSDTA
jgi:hypothetical protein